jgi:predicted alpha/beta superfamily hydrolase
MKHKSLLLLLVTALPLFAQKKAEEIFSEKLNAKRSFTVTVPPYYSQDKNKEYPLILVLDGDYMAAPFEGIFNYTGYWDELPEAIIVGVNQNYANQREEDCRVGDTGLPEGNGDKFFMFLNDELLPYLTKNYRISPFKAIAGHDATAYMASLFLYRDNSPFTGYINFSPDLQADMENRLPDILAKVTRPVFFYMCTTEGDAPKLRKKIKAMNEKMKALPKNNNLKYVFEEFQSGSHYSVVPYGIPGALYSIFDSYRPISPTEYKDKIETLPSGYVSYLEKKYKTIEKDLGVKMVIRLSDFKAIEAAILKNAGYSELKELSSLAKKNYPKKTIGEYYEGLYYEKMGDNKRANKAYMNGYSLDPIGEYTKDFMIAKGESVK